MTSWDDMTRVQSDILKHAGIQPAYFACYVTLSYSISERISLWTCESKILSTHTEAELGLPPETLRGRASSLVKVTAKKVTGGAIETSAACAKRARTTGCNEIFPWLEISLIIFGDIVVGPFMEELEIPWRENEQAKAKEEFRYRGGAKLTAAADNGVVCTIINKYVSRGELYLRHDETQRA